MTNDELGSEEYRPSYCPSCGSDFTIAVNSEDEVKIICECEAHDPEDFVMDLEDQLPLKTTDPDAVEKINKKNSDTSSKGFQ